MFDSIKAIKNLKIFSLFREEDIRRQLRRYLITGSLSAGSEYLITYGLTQYVNTWYISSNTIGLTVGFWISFLLNKYWSFGSKQGTLRQLLLYFILFAFNLAASNVIIYLLTEMAGLYYMLSKLFATGLIILWNFVIYRKVIYR